ncbi:histidine phosphatase family protein [Halorhabdus salina]|uniref:histidine phosphatase family protein n=1 Tax=Halorhabdus salina TaxID=2750670 RepID=UPI0015EEE6E0|nr:histidine phosphatase family protein [Halorhabdus salina]
MTTVVWALRHGQRQDSVDPDWDDHADRIHDPGLTDHGHWQATQAGDRLSEVTIGEIYASPFLRAAQTAGHVAAATQASVRLEPGLGEHLNPEWFDSFPERLPEDDLAERVPRIESNYRPLLEPTFPEDHEEAQRRIGEATRRIVDDASAECVLLVGHGATIGGVVAGLAGVTDGVDAPLAGLTKLVRDGESWELAFSGETAHLEE